MGSVRDWTDIRVVSRDGAKAAAVAGLDARARAVDSVEGAVIGADVVCCCTDAVSPVIDASWIAAGTHVGSVGRRNEIPRALLPPHNPYPVFVEWMGAASEPPPAGAEELQHLAEEVDLKGLVIPIGMVVLGQHP
ncbi:MAG: ornithine cyclodeaminase family protein, partial [Actinobacteria bacterium]|nr:ornithine cyclodeaminase family protein [Actinomycetota bacterium]